LFSITVPSTVDPRLFATWIPSLVSTSFRLIVTSLIGSDPQPATRTPSMPADWSTDRSSFSRTSTSLMIPRELTMIP